MFSSKILNWYILNKRDLPWRSTKKPYLIWLCESLMQQTRIEQGLPYYLKFKEHFPNIQNLAESEEQKVLNLWQGLGYYSRARNLLKAAQMVMSDFNGVFPDNYKDLLKLKGVGPYTAAAIASISFNEKVATVDGNVYRVLSRYFNLNTPVNTTKGIKEFKELATKLLPNDHFGDYNQGIMELGALVCTPKTPKCIVCPLEDSCLVSKNEQWRFLPVKEKKIKIRKRYLHYLIYSDSDKILLKKRLGKGIWENMYDFPLIEQEEELKEGVLVKTMKHKLSHQHLHIYFYEVTSYEFEELMPWGNHFCWIEKKALKNIPMPKPVVSFLTTYFKN